ncbi:MAG: hypothetical protein CL679_06730 [Bermanella sp.]|jgi:hypothetical protein|nr:hypothetical protein [Bermanella sp.]
MIRLFTALLATLMLSGCMSLNSVSLTQIPSDKGQLVSAKAHDWVFLGFTTQNNFVNEAVNNLKQECPNGKLTGVLTKHQTTAYVLVFKREVIASGYCKKA